MILHRIFTYIFVIPLFIAVIISIYFFAPISLNNELVRVVFPIDAKHEEIISKIKSDNFIRNAGFFSFIINIAFPGKKISPGAYMLSRNMTFFAVADTLFNHPYQKWIVIVPGLRLEQTAEKMKKVFGWNDTKTEEFISNSREGYLFPDTYLMNVEYTPKEMVQKMINNFNEKLDDKMQKDLLAMNVRIDTAVKIASLIERESGSDEDKALISGIIWNRLNDDMKLQLDAANQYVIGKPENWWLRVKPSDLKIDSPYNTYIYKGLPPGPICSPSLSSLKAAIYPEETDCVFYLHDRNKEIHCAKTYKEHLKNIEEYLKS